ncbi:MAG: leukotoxin LktA family filamentous adhesin, partial [Pseudomonadales bacterium]|nr:leukotoxin LktA family filamentous adhesin [Pseudomonadales bacterium]
MGSFRPKALTKAIAQYRRQQVLEMKNEALQKRRALSVKAGALPAAMGAVFSSGAFAVDTTLTVDSAFTEVDTDGGVHDVHSKVTSGNTAINVFNTFVVGTNDTVNLHFDEDGSNQQQKLVNVIKGTETPAVHGIMNSYKNGSLGGNVTFISASGFLVGASGVVNVGKLSIRTPEQSQITALLGEDRASQVFQDKLDVLNGANPTFAVSSTGVVKIQGRIYAKEGVEIYAKDITVDKDDADGANSTGAIIVGETYTINAAVNVGNITLPTELIVDGDTGTIMLTAKGGTVHIDGALLANAGISISADTIALNAASLLDTSETDTRLNVADISLDASNIELAGDIYADKITVTGDSSITIAAGDNDIRLADKYSRTTVTDAGVDDVLIVGDLDVEGNLILTGDLVKTTVGQETTAKNVTVTGSEVFIGGTINADGAGSSAGDITITAPDITLANTGLLNTNDSDVNTTTGDGDVTLTASHSDSVGQGSVSTAASISLNGAITAKNISAIATADASASFTDDLGAWVATTAGTSLMTGITMNLVEANAIADVTVGSTANIKASGDIDLASVASAVASDPAVQIISGGAAVAFVYGAVDVDSTTHIQKGATVEAGNDLSVTAHNEAALAVRSLSINASNTNKLSAAVTIGEANVDATAKIDSGVTLDARNLTVTADNQNDFYVSATSYGLKSTTMGAGIAYGNFDTNTTATLGSGLKSGEQAGNILVASVDRNNGHRVHSSSQVGSSVVMRTIGGAAINAMDKVQTFVSSKTPNGLLTKAFSSGSNSGSVKFKFGAAFSITEADHEAYAYIGASEAGIAAPDIDASGDVLVVSELQNREFRSSAESAVASGNGTSDHPTAENSASLAFNILLSDNDSVAEIGDGVTISANNVGVGAYNIHPIDITYDEWAEISDIMEFLQKAADTFNNSAGLANNLLTTFANATGDAEGSSGSGSLNYLDISHNTKAWIGDDVVITATADADNGFEVSFTQVDNLGFMGEHTYTWKFDESVTVDAKTRFESIHIAGNMGTFLIFPDATGSSGDDAKSLGASVTYVGYDGNTIAGIGESKIDAGSGDVEVQAVSEDFHVVITPTSGMGSGLGVNAIAGTLNFKNKTHASIDSRAEIVADQVSVLADQMLNNWVAAGAVAWTDENAVGMAIAINLQDVDTKAYIGDNSGDDSSIDFASSMAAPAASSLVLTPSITTNEVNVVSRTYGLHGALAVAGALKTEKSDEDGIGKTFENKWNNSTKGFMGSYGSASNGDDESSAGSAGSNGASGDEADSGDSSQQSFALSAAGSIAIDVADINTLSEMGHTPTNGSDAQQYLVLRSSGNNETDINVQALQNTEQVSFSGAAALLFGGKDPAKNSAAIAGAVAYQISENNVEALIYNTDANAAGAVNVQALQSGYRLGIALGIAVNKNGGTGTDVSAAVSASIAETKDRTAACLIGSTITANGDANNEALEISAYNSTDMGVGGGSLYGGGTAGLGLAISYANIDDQADDKPSIEARIEDSTLIGFHSADVSARNVSNIGIGAAGIGLSKEENALGFVGSFAIAQISSNVEAIIKSSTITMASSGTVNLTALGSRVTNLDSILDDLKKSSNDAGSGFDFSGAAAYDNNKVHTTDNDDDGSAIDYGNHEGERIIAVAGVVQAGKGNNLGLSYVHTDIETVRKAKINDSTITTQSVNVDARNESLMYNVAVGLGVSTGKLSGM